VTSPYVKLFVYVFIETPYARSFKSLTHQVLQPTRVFLLVFYQHEVNGHANAGYDEADATLRWLLDKGKQQQAKAKDNEEDRNAKVHGKWSLQIRILETPSNQTHNGRCVPNPVGEHAIRHELKHAGASEHVED
jgi:hypothetical protein